VEFKAKNLILSRSNDTSLFKGLNDNANLTFKKKSTLLTTSQEFPKVSLGPFVLMFFQADVTDLTLSFSKLLDKQYQNFENFDAILTAYPEVVTHHPNSIPYFLREVRITAGTRYQCIYINGSPGQLRWVKVDGYTGRDVDIITGLGSYNYLSNYSDVKTIVLALPIRQDIYVDQSGITDSRLLTYQDLVSVNKPDFLIDVKMVEDYFIPYTSLTNTYDSVNKTCVTKFTPTGGRLSNDQITVPSLSNVGVLQFGLFNNEFNISRTASLTYDQFPPFKKYFLQVFGERYLINPRYHSPLYMYLNVTSGLINYIIYHNDRQNIIASGSLTTFEFFNRASITFESSKVAA
jgi:hypothetical protein